MYPTHSNPILTVFPRVLLFFICWVFLSPAVLAQANQSRGLHYYEGSFTDMQRQASRSQKPYIMYFYTSWAPTCQEMEDKTFSNRSLRAYLADNYLVYRINAEASRGEGPVLAEAYNVKFYPTIIVCGPDESVLGRFSGAKEPEALLEELMNYQQSVGSISLSVPQTYEMPAPKPLPSGQVQAETWEEPPIHGKPVSSFDHSTDYESDVWEPSTPVTPEAAAEDVLDLPTISAFGVQVGAYSVEANARAVQKRLRDQMNRELLVREQVIDSRVLYKVIIGPFWDRVEARQYQNTFQVATGKNCIVIEYQP